MKDLISTENKHTHVMVVVRLNYMSHIHPNALFYLHLLVDFRPVDLCGSPKEHEGFPSQR